MAETLRMDLHNHTTRCKHAEGSMRSYICRGIELGIDIFGFSDHAPLRYDEDYRMEYGELAGYQEELLALKQEYAPKIEILYGLEADFLKHHPELMYPEILNLDVDYLIGSVHFLDDWGFDNPAFIAEYAKRNLESCWQEYLDCVIEMADSRNFQIVGHFDLLKVFNHKPPKAIESKIIRALEAIKNAGMALEINASGLRKPVAEQYPSSEILCLANEMGIEICFGSDAHSLDHVGYGYEKCVEAARSAGYNRAVYFVKKQKKFCDF